MQWKKGDVVMADWNGCFYKAKIIDVSESDGETHYKIHYENWSSKWDQIIPESRTDQWKAFTVEAEEAAKKQIKDLKATPKRRKRSAAAGETLSAPKKEAMEQTIKSKNLKAKHRQNAAGDGTPSEPEKDGNEQTTLLDVPEIFQSILFEDYDKMAKQGLYVALPAKVTIREIIQEFCAKIAASNEEEITVEVEYANGKKTTEKTTKHELMGFGHMMERLINSLFTKSLCVDQEKQQIKRLEEELVKINKKSYNDLVRPFAPSKHFGVVYLLRLFVRLNGDSGFIDACDHYSFVKHSSYWLKYLLDNIDNYYDKDAYNETDLSDRSTA